MTTKINPLWTAYNNLHNEGGEGYNPHPKHVDGSGEPQWSILDTKRARLTNRLNVTSTSDPHYTAMEQELAELEAAVKIAQKEGI